jgi:hypothetical protein
MKEFEMRLMVIDCVIVIRIINKKLKTESAHNQPEESKPGIYSNTKFSFYASF